MARVLITLALACVSLAAQQAQTFAMNWNSAYIAEMNSLLVPTPPFPRVNVFIAGNVTDRQGYSVVATWIDATGKTNKTSPAICPVSTATYDSAGDTITLCEIMNVDIPTNALVQITNVQTGSVAQVLSDYTCTTAAAPVITSVDSASAYGGYPYFASGSWLEIKGTNLANSADARLISATNPGQWTAADFSGANAPTMLDGVSVSIDGKPAYVWYLSPGQLNVQAPEDTATGNVQITVNNCKATSNAITFARQALAPGLLAPSNYASNGTPYMVATFASDGAYVLTTAAGASFGLSRPAKPGDLIVLYGVGFGDVTPAIAPGVVVQQSNALVNPVSVSFGTTPATLAYAGLAGNFVGLYEFYVTVPASLANGDYQVKVTQNGTAVPQTAYLTVHN